MDETFESAHVQPIPDFSGDLPTYFPMHPNLRLNNEYLKISHLKVIEELLNEVIKSVQKFLGYVASNPHLLEDPNTAIFLELQRDTYMSILRSKLELQSLQNSFGSGHQEVMATKQFDSPLRVENYHTYKEMEKPDFADIIMRHINDSTTLPKVIEQHIKNDYVLHYLRHAKFVLENPEDPLPDESTDEELAVSGGKISLKDPLSMDFFSEPVMSKVCKHVFENKHISQQLARTRQIDCPITGCEAVVNSRDLQDDLLMALRVKAFQARDKKREQRVRI